MENTPEENRMYQIQPYEALSEEVRALVDADVAMLHQMSDADILQYGWNLQDEKSKHLNEVMSRFDTSSSKEIDAILDDIMDSQKSVIPRSRRFFVREYKPSPEQKREFVGKVGELEVLLKRRIDSILSNNLSYYDLISECKDLVDQYAICMMALDRYLAETDDMVLKDVLLKKKQSLASVRIANIQSALMYMKLYQNNALLANHLNEVIHLNLHQLQEQVLIQTETNKIKNALKECQNIKETIQTLSKKNIQELGNVGKMLEHGIDEPQAEEAERQMQALLLSLKSQAPKESEATIPVPIQIAPMVQPQKLKMVKDWRGMWNFRREDGSYVSTKWYRDIQKFSEDFAVVQREDKRFNYMRRDGSILCDEWFDEAKNFHHGFGVVKVERKIDETRNLVFRWNVVNTDGKPIGVEWFEKIVEVLEDSVIVQRCDGRQNILLQNGDYLSRTWYHQIYPPDETSKISIVRGQTAHGDTIPTYSFIDQYGEPLTEEWFLYVSNFCEDVAVVRKGNSTLFNYLKLDGKTYLSDTWYSEAHDFFDGLGRIREYDGNFNFLKKDGTLLLDVGYDYAWDYSCGFARVRREEDHFQNFIDREGHLISDIWYSNAEDFEGDFAQIINGEGYKNYLTKEGKPLSDTWFEEAEPFSCGLSKVKIRDEQYNYLKTDGKLLLNRNYIDVMDFEEHIGLGAVMRNNEMWFLIKKDGTPLDLESFLYVWFPYRCLIVVENQDDGKISVLTPEGLFLTSSSYENIFYRISSELEEHPGRLFDMIELKDGTTMALTADGTPVYEKWNQT